MKGVGKMRGRGGIIFGVIYGLIYGYYDMVLVSCPLKLSYSKISMLYYNTLFKISR